MEEKQGEWTNELFLKRTPTSDRLLADSELRYPYEGSKKLMHVFDSFDDKSLILELLNGMYAELPEKKPKKAKWDRKLLNYQDGWWNVIPEETLPRQNIIYDFYDRYENWFMAVFPFAAA